MENPIVAGESIVDALSLDDTERWSELQHAYGPASDTPSLLRQLATFPPSNDTDEPWLSLWSSLAHQGDVHSASFAAVPHVIRTLATDPARADAAFFHFPAWVEICRQKSAVPIPDDLREPYFAALGHLPRLVGETAMREWDGDFLRCVLAAIAAAKGHGAVAEAALELQAEVATEFLDWFSSR